MLCRCTQRHTPQIAPYHAPHTTARQVTEDPTVKCMVAEGRLSFVCKEPKRLDGSTIELLQEGRFPSDITEADARMIAELYVNAVDSTVYSSLPHSHTHTDTHTQCSHFPSPWSTP